MSNKTISSLVVALVVVLALIGFLYSLGVDYEKVQDVTKDNFGGNSLDIVTMEVQKSNSNIVISDRFVGKVDSDSTIISISNNGKIRIVEEGVVLIDGKIISVEGESTSIYNIKSPSKSIN